MKKHEVRIKKKKKIPFTEGSPTSPSKGEVGNKRHTTEVMAISQSFIALSEVYYRPQ